MLAAANAAASPEDIFGYGNRSPAMGGTGAASSTGFEAAYTNPALVARTTERKLTLGMQAANFALYANDERISALPMKGIVIGAESPVPFGGVLKDRVALALAFYTPTDILVRGRILYPETPNFPLVADRAQSLMVRAAIGVNLPWGLRVGAGFAALAEIDGSVLVATDATGRVGSRVEDQLVATYAPTLGVAWDLPWDKAHPWRVGATYRGKLDARFAVEIDATKLSTLQIPIFNIAGIAQFDPAQIALEVAHEHGPWTFAAGGVFKQWSAFPGLLEPTIVCPDGGNDCGLSPPKIDFKDTIVLRAGVERKIELTKTANAFARAGAVYEPSPVPKNLPSSQAYDLPSASLVDVPTRFYDGNRVVLTIGGGVELRDPLPPVSVDAWMQYHALSGSYDLAAGNHVDTSGHVMAIGLLAGVRF
jgi:long-chain fatty acid transport protein